jgi:hypothetical protein
MRTRETVNLPDPPYAGDEKRIAATRSQKRSENAKQPEISLDGPPESMSVPSRLTTRGQM